MYYTIFDKYCFADCKVYVYQNNCDVLVQRTLTSAIKKTHYIKEKIKDCTRIGILICSLSIKGLLERINRIKYLCKSTNKKCYIFSVGRPNVAKLANFPEVIYAFPKTLCIMSIYFTCLD